MTSVSALSIARVIAEDITGNRCLRMDNFDNADKSIVSSVSTVNGIVTFYMTMRTDNGPKTFQVEIKETN